MGFDWKICKCSESQECNVKTVFFAVSKMFSDFQIYSTNTLSLIIKRKTEKKGSRFCSRILRNWIRTDCFSIHSLMLLRFPSQIIPMSRRSIFPARDFIFSLLSRCVREMRRWRRRKCGTHSRCCCPGFDVFHSFFRAPGQLAFPQTHRVRLGAFVHAFAFHAFSERRRIAAIMQRGSFPFARICEALTHSKSRAVSRWLRDVTFAVNQRAVFCPLVIMLQSAKRKKLNIMNLTGCLIDARKKDK